MNIEATIARIPAMTADQRKTLRTNAEAKLASDDPKWTDSALKVITALDALDAEEGRIANAARSSRLGNLDGCSPVERIVIAFELDPISPGEDKLIQTLLDHPGSTCAELSRRHGWEETAWDMQYGYMCPWAVAGSVSGRCHDVELAGQTRIIHHSVRSQQAIEPLILWRNH